MIWPPVTMATQHPDNASAPWWGKDPYISTQDEITELLTLFRELPIDEYMWDWEGKYVDEAVGEKLFSRAKDFFAAHPLGSDHHLTYRIPAWEENRTHRSARAFMNILSLADLAQEIGLDAPPVTEMFLPLTTTAKQPLAARQAFLEVAEYHRTVFHSSVSKERDLLSLVRVTPLVEDIDSLFSIENIVEPYWKELLRDTSADRSHGQRIFLARSDPAMNSGLVPAVLAVRAALAKAHEVGGCLGFDVFPILGTGSLPFRGSVNPTYTETFLNQYAGTSTYSIQSAFRYDYPLADVRSALELMHREVPMRKGTPMTDHERAKVRDLAELFVAAWGSSIESIAPIINQIAAFVPSRRERLLHIGLFGYSRGVGAVKLPRAIVFTAALYSLGVPPELIATGRGLRAAAKAKLMPLLDSHYPALREDIVHAGKYFNAENLSLLAAQYPAFEEIKEDIAGIEEILGITLGPVKPHHVIHRNITSTILHRLATPDSAAITRDIVEAGVIRRSLG